MESVSNLKQQESLLLNVGTARSVGVVEKIKGNEIEMKLKIPVCADKGDRFVFSRQVLGRWRLIGWGELI
jgi:translation initiation factor 2 subunit 3